MVVLLSPRTEFGLELLEGPEDHPAVEVLLVGSVAPLHLPAALRAPVRDILMGSSKIMQVPDEVLPCDRW